jgi:hypothetical protein
MADKPDTPIVVPLYGVPIHQCIERGDHDEMLKLAAEASAHVAEVSAALEKLVAAIGSSYAAK